MRPVNEGDPKSMDKFADALERTIVVLKNNSLHADLGGGTLYGIVVEKLPENLLKEYYHWVNGNSKRMGGRGSGFANSSVGGETWLYSEI